MFPQQRSTCTILLWFTTASACLLPQLSLRGHPYSFARSRELKNRKISGWRVHLTLTSLFIPETVTLTRQICRALLHTLSSKPFLSKLFFFFLNPTFFFFLPPPPPPPPQKKKKKKKKQDKKTRRKGLTWGCAACEIPVQRAGWAAPDLCALRRQRRRCCR